MATHPDQTTHDLAHLAFCALVALQSAVQDGAVTSPMAEHLFIVRWLATTQKQKRFSKTVVIDTQLLLNKSCKQGVSMELIQLQWVLMLGNVGFPSNVMKSKSSFFV